MTAIDLPPETLRTLIKDIRFAMLTTRGADGSLHSRPMATLEEEIHDKLWFFTGRSTHISADIAAIPQVNLSYTDSASQRYISICGRAEVVENHDRIRELWRPAYAVWFPLGIDDPDLVLLRINVDSIDFWQSPTTWISRTLAFAKALVTGETTTAKPQTTHYHGDGRQARVIWAALAWIVGIPLPLILFVALIRGGP